MKHIFIILAGFLCFGQPDLQAKETEDSKTEQADKEEAVAEKKEEHEEGVSQDKKGDFWEVPQTIEEATKQCRTHVEELKVPSETFNYKYEQAKVELKALEAKEKEGKKKGFKRHYRNCRKYIMQAQRMLEHAKDEKEEKDEKDQEANSEEEEDNTSSESSKKEEDKKEASSKKE